MRKILWIHGNSGAGKTTLAKGIQKEYGGIILDGDAMRGCWELGFSMEDRFENNIRIAKIAKVLFEQGYDVIVSTIFPYKRLRRLVKNIIDYDSIELLGGQESSIISPYEMD